MAKAETVASEYSFKKGWDQLRGFDRADVKESIMSALGITTRQAWHQRKNGEIEPKVSVAAAIEKAFAEKEIFDVWGE